MPEGRSIGQTAGLAVFTLFKYAIYVLLTVNAFLFLRDDWAASQQIFDGGIRLGEIIQGYAATIDTFAWVILLLMFEAETSLIPDEKIKGLVKWSLHGLRVFCYGFIGYAFYGYFSKLMMAFSFAPFQVDDLCALVGSADLFLVVTLDEYIPLALDNCIDFANQGLFLAADYSLIADQTGLTLLRNLAWTDVINSGTWILVVLILEFDVRMQLRHELSGRVLKISFWIKVALYSILLVAAVYWWYDGVFLDFWDAFLWLLAFFFIELNIFRWQSETEQEQAQ